MIHTRRRTSFLNTIFQVFFLIFSLLFINEASASTYNLGEYFPLITGDSWEARSGSETDITIVKGPITVNGASCQKMGEAGSDTETYFSFDGNYLRLHGLTGSSSLTPVFNSPVIMAPAMIDDGANYSNTTTYYYSEHPGYTFTYTFYFNVLAREDVILDNGLLIKDAIKVSWKQKASYGSTSEESSTFYLWLAKDIGIVKSYDSEDKDAWLLKRCTTHYTSGNIKTEILDMPGVDGAVRFSRLDEDFYGDKKGRYASSERISPNGLGELAFKYQYHGSTGVLKYKHSFSDPGRERKVATYEYDLEGALVSITKYYDDTNNRIESILLISPDGSGRTYYRYVNEGSDGYSSALGLNGSSQYLSVGDNDAFSFGGGDFTIETWVKFDTIGGTAQTIFSQASSGNAYMALRATSSGFSFRADTTVFSYSGPLTASDSLKAGVWYHIALERKGNTYTIYRDGIAKGSGIDNSIFPNYPGDLVFGREDYNGWGGSYLDGCLREIRVSGTARYAGNFDVPTTQFLKDDSTKLLVHLNGEVGSSEWEDTSQYLHEVIGHGGVVQIESDIVLESGQRRVTKETFNVLNSKGERVFQYTYFGDSSNKQFIDTFLDDGQNIKIAQYEYNEEGELINSISYDPVFNYYLGSQRIKDVTCETSINGFKYFYFVDEDWAGSGCGRIDSVVLEENNERGERAFSYSYENGTWLVKSMTAYADTTRTQALYKYIYNPFSGEVIAKEFFKENNADSEYYGKHVVYHYAFEGDESSRVSKVDVLDDDKAKGVLSLKGADAFVDCGTNASLDLRKEFTLAVNAKIVPGGGGYLIAKRDGNESQYGVAISPETGRLVFVYGDARSPKQLDLNFFDKDWRDGEWHEFVVTVSTSSDGKSCWVTGYVDGVAYRQRSTRYSSGDIGTSRSQNKNWLIVDRPDVPVYLGARGDGQGGSAYNLDGVISGARIYNKCLTSSEVQAISSSGEVSGSLVSRWTFGEESGDSVHDDILDNNGTIRGTNWDRGKDFYWESTYFELNDPYDQRISKKVKKDNQTGEVSEVLEYYDNADNRLKSRTLTLPDENGDIYFEYLDENWEGQEFGRLSVRKSFEPNSKGEDRFAIEYYPGTENIKTITTYGSVGEFCKCLFIYEYDTNGNVVSSTSINEEFDERYTIESLGYYKKARCLQLNDYGEAVWTTDGPPYDIYFYDGESVKNITNDENQQGYPNITDSGEVVWLDHSGAGYVQVITFDHGHVEEGPLLTGREELSVSDDGNSIAAEDRNPWRISYKFGSVSGTIYPPDYGFQGFDDILVNNKGQIAWTGRLLNDNFAYAVFLYDGSKTIQITDGTSNAYLWDLNNSGQIAITCNGEVFLWDGDSLERYSNGQGGNDSPSVNDLGHMLWNYKPGGSVPSVLKHSYGGAECEVNADIIATSIEWSDINDRGEMIWSDGGNVYFRKLVDQSGAASLGVGNEVLVGSSEYDRSDAQIAILEEIYGQSEVNRTKNRISLLDSGVSGQVLMGEEIVVSAGEMETGSLSHAGKNARIMNSVTPDSEILSIRVLDDEGHTTSASLSQAIIRSLELGAKVIAMPLTLTPVSAQLENVIKSAADAGVFMFAAAGNEGKEIGKYSLAAQEGVITVASCDNDGSLSSWSNYGDYVDIVAPWDVLKENGADGKVEAGTSFSTAYVAGIAALLLESDPDMTREELIDSINDITAPAAMKEQLKTKTKQIKGVSIDEIASKQQAVQTNRETFSGYTIENPSNVPTVYEGV